ncbi:hypothetical protein LTR78_008419 [Recurvomyces mirabilis]|uniref:Uncharacterized protein n=1 Tax=Recurvomyces mirabilis TaxID=574656 RepID=A0AAE0WGZ4_9PEZI|nr:hypothetical protein LTR78_008419 [Recurvomyces mirabilis]KAK5155407.1 hypothetical protein LTS14_005668 [Recurvomyces mirabilis]
MVSKLALALATLHVVSTATGHPSLLDRKDNTRPSSVPASASYNYLVPALYLNLTVKAVLDLGTLATGGEQLLGDILDGRLYSEPGFTPQFSGRIRYAEDYLTSDPDGAYARPSCVMTVVPDNGYDKPFLLRISGVQKANPNLDIIFAGNTTGLQVPYGYSYSVWTPTFFGGSANYSNLQDSVFVGSETASSSPIAGAFTVGMKFSKVFPVNTTIVIGKEFP